MLCSEHYCTRPFSEGPSWRFGNRIQVCKPQIFWGHESDVTGSMLASPLGWSFSSIIQSYDVIDGVIDVIGTIHAIPFSV